MKKHLILLVLPFLFACNIGGKKEAALADSLKNVNTNIKSELTAKENLLNSKEAAMAEFITSFNEIEKNLNEIKAKEKLISSGSKSKEFLTSKKDQIIADIQTIYDLLDNNKKKMVGLTKKLKDSNLKIDELNKAVNNLANRSIEKEDEISSLKIQLEKLNVDFASLKQRYVEEQQASDLKTAQLNTAYYAIGTKKELIKKGLITKEGGFIGLGKDLDLSTKIDQNALTKIDISHTTEIPIHGDKVKLISTHQEGSYKLVEGSASIDKIVILDTEKFWSISKYLVITSEKH